MTIAEWINEAPGRMIVIVPSGPDGVPRPGYVRLHARSVALGQKVACDIQVSEGLLSESRDPGAAVVDEITKATECLIYSIKDRN